LTREQLLWFKAKFSELNYKKQRELRTSGVRPAAVRAAERIVKRHERKVQGEATRRRERLSAAAELVQEAMLFGDAARIQKAFNTFKSFKP
jgi:hypothetical protein